MAIDRSVPLNPPLWRGRVLEWSLVAAVIVAVALAFLREMREVQAQAEVAAVKSTLGALRMALVIDYARQMARTKGESVASTQRNPFGLLQRRPANYLGELGRARAALVPAGSWVFDSDCSCVGYRPLHAQGVGGPSGDTMLWYGVRTGYGAPELVARDAYVWQGQAMD